MGALNNNCYTDTCVRILTVRAMSIHISKILLLASIGLFLWALTQDGYYIEGSNPRAWAPAWVLLLLGWVGLFHGVFAWFANPLLALGWAFSFSGKYREGSWISGAAILFILSFLLHSTVISSEAPTYSKITGYGLGYWVWIASATALFLSNILALTLLNRDCAKARSPLL